MKIVLFFSTFILFCHQSAAFGPCSEKYIPEHTTQELYQLRDWAIGGAFSVYAKFAGYDFDKVSYMETCPNLAIFNFGRVVGPQCTQSIDVLASYMSVSYVLEKQLSKDKEGFSSYFYEQAVEYGFDQF